MFIQNLNLLVLVLIQSVSARLAKSASVCLRLDTVVLLFLLIWIVASFNYIQWQLNLRLLALSLVFAAFSNGSALLNARIPRFVRAEHVLGICAFSIVRILIRLSFCLPFP